MSRYTPTRAAATTGRRGRGARRTLLAVVVLAAVVTAHAPAVITVKPGDTLWDLAKRHGTSVSDLQRLNGLDGRAVIYACQTLRTSGSASSGSSGGPGRTHRVVSGDTLSTLAKSYGTTSRAIASANGLSGTTIRIGQRLTIPRGAAAGQGAVPTHNAGVRIPQSVRASVAENRAKLAQRRVPSKSEARAMVARTARKHGVPVSLAVAVAFHESGFQQRVVSPVDAIGVMQVLPSTGRALDRRLDLLDAQDNVTAGVLLLKQLLRSTGSTDKALAAYYQGLGSISRRGWLPQTHTYVKNINALRPRFANG